MSKRLPPLILLTALFLTFLAACAGDEESDNDLVLTLTADAIEAPDQGLPKAEETELSEEAEPAGEEPVSIDEPQGADPEPTQVGQASAALDSDFEVQPDGFSFRNYGAGFPEGDFTITDLRSIFGDGVCSRIDGEDCIPSAEALQWISDRNADMASGHCIGFTVASYRFFDGDFQPSIFTPDAAVPFDITQEAAIMRTIAANGSLYWVDSVWSSEVSGTPKEVVEALTALGEPVDLSIFLPGLGGGHSLLAFDVLEVEPDLFHILTYDNNFPGEETFVEVNTAANTWRYDQGAVNPDQEAVPYEGDATTETLRFIPLSAYDTASCPFCPADEEEAGGFSLLSFLGRGQALVSNDSGTINLASGGSSSTIPGAELIYKRGQLSADSIPDVAMPAGSDFDLTFDGLQRISSLNDNFSLQLEELPASAMQNQLSVDLGNQSFSYQPGGHQVPVLKMTLHQDNMVYDVTLLGVDLSAGQDISLGLTPGGGGLAISSDAVDFSEATLLIGRLAAGGESIFGSSALDLGQAQGLALDISNWSGSGSINQFGDLDGDGNFDQPLNRLANESVDQLLSQSNPALVGYIVESLTPFLDDQGLQGVIDLLPQLNLSADVLGQILQPLNLTEEQLLGVIDTANLPVTELSELIFNLRLDGGDQETLIADLGLGTDDLQTLESSLADLDNLHEILIDWAFMDSDDPLLLASFLRDQNLTAAQLVDLLPMMALNPSQTAAVLVDLQLSNPAVQDVIENSGFSPEELQELSELMGLDLEELNAADPNSSVTPTPTGTTAAQLTPSITPTATQQGNVTATATVESLPTDTPTAVGNDPTPESTSTPVLPSDSQPDPTATSPAVPTATPEPYPG